jgi:UDPglucose--hexose-1-phosphate uridylyltransferase
MTTIDFKENPHKRLNILNGEWVLVSPQRAKRPWQGKMETLQATDRPQFDADCYLCPGNKRADGSINPKYTSCFSFTNDFSPVLKNTPEGNYNEHNLLVAKNQSGICRVICFSPRHDLTLPQLSNNEILEVIELWCKEFESLKLNKEIKYILIFENKGEIMGCSNPHPHGQIWSTSDVPGEPMKETIQQKRYFDEQRKSLLSDYLQLELEQKERIIFSNEHFVALVPFWAVWPFEIMIISKRHVQTILEFNTEEKNALAEILKIVTIKYDNIFEISFPYSAGMHQSPVNDGEHPEWHWHMHFYPPLLRSATIKKFMVGFEMLGNPQRDITPEAAAEKLRNISTVHYKLTH